MTSQKPQILYLDDEKANLDVFYSSFYEDFDISLAQNPKEAFELLASKPIQILLADQRMPEISGIEFIKNSKSQFPDLISIIITAYANLDDVISAVNEVNVYRFLTKPWNQQHLKHTIFEAFDVYNLRQNNKKLVQELKDQYVELEKAYQQAKSSDKLKSVFIKNLSHEIRTPLNGIIGFAQLLLDHPLDHDQVIKYASFIHQSGIQLTDIIDDILTISIIQSGTISKYYSIFNLKNLIDDIVSYFRQVNSNPNVEIFYIYRSDLPENIKCDQEKTRKIIEKLVANGLKFTSAGFVEIICSTTTLDGQKAVKIDISDTGTGIPETEIDKIFKPFSQLVLTPGQFISGMGTGLVISKAFIETLNGKLELKTVHGKGSVFSVILPLLNE
jgi:signal transduction histidine kinase